MIEQHLNIAAEPRTLGERIQVDMFDVQLGAALLIQFRNNDGEVVRVLADAGVDPRSRYPQDHALVPLKHAMRDFDSGSLRTDLMIGTHYDADHLEGLIPIINDPDIEITGAWMPPVANDTEPHALEDQPHEGQLLAKQFDSENGDAVLQTYFAAKLQDCEKLLYLQRIAKEFAATGGREREHSGQDLDSRNDRRAQYDRIDVGMFNRHFEEAAADFGESRDSYTHADDDIQISPGFAPSYDQPSRIPWWNGRWIGNDGDLQYYWSQHRSRASIDVRASRC